MIRFDQRNIDIQGTERVFKKVVHSGQNAIRFVDKDGVPMRAPNTAALSRLHSTYTVSPRGVPTRKTNHSYSGQLTQAKMQNMVNSLETNAQEMACYPSVHSYPNGISSAGSSRHYLSTANSQKRRSLSQPRSVKSMAKSASSQRSQRMLVSTPAADQFNQDPALEVTNDSPQGKRLEKEWSALSQCRALKRSSEIVSHRVDRMYFMSGNKLRLQAKYHVEEEELRRLQELQLARRTSPASRSGRSRKGELYKSDIHKMSNGDIQDGLVVSDGGRRASKNGIENGHKENKDPQVLVSQKTLNPRPPSNSKSPIQGWAGEDHSEKGTTVANGIISDNSLHNADVTEEEDYKGPNVFVTDAIENGEEKELNQGNVESEGETEQNAENNNAEINGFTSKEVVFTSEEVVNENLEEEEVSEKLENLEILNQDAKNSERLEDDMDEKGINDATSVHKTEETSESSDKDKTEVKTEDYLGK